jgi:1-acyl-sn-glycerol-3-phosphate acyltransferase
MILRWLYGVYAALAFALIVLATLLLLIVLPGVGRRRAAARAGSRAWMWACGMPLEVRHLERLPATQCVVVANHISYADGVVLTAALPPRFAFVIKREMDSVPLGGLLLRRLGSEFVERFDRHKGATDARRVIRNAAGGQSLVFFPEGTFQNVPGLMRFHTGAFVTAARAGCPVVPCAIRGTREAVPPGSLLPAPARVVIEFLEPITSSETRHDHATAELRDRSRAALLAHLGEPDLTAATPD